MTTLRLIDAHCHLDDSGFDSDREAVLQRAKDNHISDIIIPGTRREHWQRISKLCLNHSNCHPCYGLHPYWSASHSDEDIAALEDYLASHPAVGVGECGLDFRSQHIADDAARQRQVFQFESQLDIARRTDLPVVIHAVRATQAVIDSLKNFPGIRGMIHSYSGSLEQAGQLIGMGFYISIGAVVTCERANRLRQVAGNIPLEAMLLETDAPDQPGCEHPDERNEPAWLAETVASIAQLRGDTVQEVAARTTSNACTLFGID